MPKPEGADGPPLVLRLPYEPPLAWAALCRFLALRGPAEVEVVRGGRYARTLDVGGRLGWVDVTNDFAGYALAARVSPSLRGELDQVTVRLRHLFDLDAASTQIDAWLARDGWLRPRVMALPGVRVPGMCSAFALLLRTVVGQQVSVRGATTLYSRFVRRYGRPISTPCPGLAYGAPEAPAVADAPAAEIAALGLPRRRAETVALIARAIATGTLRVARDVAPQELKGQLQEISGVGRWTAEYVAMRALHDADAFPASDLGVLHALGSVSAHAARARAETWRPWRAYAVMRLWQGP